MTIATTPNLQNAIKAAVDTSKLIVTVNFGGSIGIQDISNWVIDASGRSEETFALTQGANANRCNLTLDNTDGRFSPRNTKSPYYGGLTPNKPISISVGVGPDAVAIFTGYTSIWSPAAKAYTCQVEGYDAAVVLKRIKITPELIFNQTTPTNGVTFNWVFERAAWLAGIRWDWVTTYDATYANSSQANYNSDGSVGTPTSITVVPNNTLTTAIYRLGGSTGNITMRVDIIQSGGNALRMKATSLTGFGLDVISQLAQVVDGKVFFDATGALRMRSRMYVGDASSPADTVTVDNLDDSQFSQNYEGTTQVPMVNSVTVTGTPLDFQLDSSGNIAETPLNFLASGYLPFTGGQTYPGTNDPPYYVTLPNNYFILKTPGYPDASKFQITSSLATDTNPLLNNGVVWASGYPIYSTNQVQLKFVNNNSAAVNVSSLTLKVKLAAPRLKLQSYAQDTTSIGLYGQRDKTLNNDFIPSSIAAVNLANWLVASGKDLKDVLTLPLAHGMPWLELSDTLAVSETVTNTVPTATNYVIRAYTWKWALDSYTQSFECVPPAPAFSLQTAVTNSSPVTASLQTASIGGQLPQNIDTTKALVGLNTIPAFAEILSQAKAVPAGTGISSAVALTFDGADIFVAQNGPDAGTSNNLHNKVVNRINNMTGSLIGTANAINASGYIYSLKTKSGLVFLTDVDTTNGQTVQVLAASSFNGGTFTTKANLKPAGKVPYEVFFYGGKMYVTARNASTGQITLNVWNTVSSTQQDTPDVVYVLGTSGNPPVRAAVGSNGVIYVPVGTAIAAFDTNSNTVTSDVLAPSQGLTIYCVAHDGLSLWAGYNNGSAWKVARLDPSSTGLVANSQVKALLGADGIYYDGYYIWVAAQTRLYQISTTNQLITEFTTAAPGGGFMAFDGYALWQAGDDANIYRVPRLVSGRQF